MLTHWLTHSLTHSLMLTHSFTHSLMLTHALTHSLIGNIVLNKDEMSEGDVTPITETEIEWAKKWLKKRA